MDMWTPPPGATPQQYAGPADPRDGAAALARLLSELKAVMRDMPNHLLQQSGISVTPEGMTIDRDLRLLGTLTADQVIDNSALKSPVTFAGNSGKILATAPPGTLTVACSANLTIPDWAGYGVVMAVGSIAATTGASGASLIGDIVIDGDAGDMVSRYVPSNESETLPVLHQRTFDPSGTTVSVQLRWRGSPAVFAGGAAYLIAMGVFGR